MAIKVELLFMIVIAFDKDCKAKSFTNIDRDRVLSTGALNFVHDLFKNLFSSHFHHCPNDCTHNCTERSEY